MIDPKDAGCDFLSNKRLAIEIGEFTRVQLGRETAYLEMFHSLMETSCDFSPCEKLVLQTFLSQNELQARTLFQASFDVA